MSKGSYEIYMINRNEEEPITFDGTFTREWVEHWATEARAAGYRTEYIGDGPERFARIIFEQDERGRPVVYAEVYPVVQS